MPLANIGKTVTVYEHFIQHVDNSPFFRTEMSCHFHLLEVKVELREGQSFYRLGFSSGVIGKNFVKWIDKFSKLALLRIKSKVEK